MGRLFFFITCLTVITSTSVYAQEPQQKLPEKTRILFMLDGSGSMLAKWGDTNRITAAKKLLAETVDSLAINENLELALRVYGHQFERYLKRCNDSKLEVPFRKGNQQDIKNKLREIRPKGTTPIAYSLEQAGGDFPEGEARNIIIIITDGIESCDGDPCAVSLALQKKNIFLKPFIIGIGMDKKFEDAFGCMGAFYDASNIYAFRNALKSALFQSLEETSVSIELLDTDDLPSVTDINVSFINSFTKSSAFEFVHYRDEQGQPDSVEVDPVLIYDVVVNTIPPVIRSNVAFKAGEHNVIKIPAPQGIVKVTQPGHTEYPDGVRVLIKDKANGNLLTHFLVPGEAKILTGQYIVEVLTLPKNTFSIDVNENKTRELMLEKPGVVNLLAASKGIASLYKINEDGTQRWIYNVNKNKLRNTITLQPGTYKVVFRSIKALGSKYTKVHLFRITPGSSLNIQL